MSEDTTRLILAALWLTLILAVVVGLGFVVGDALADAARCDQAQGVMIDGNCFKVGPRVVLNR